MIEIDVIQGRIQVPRTYRYASLGRPNGAEELWYVLHGYGQLASRFLRSFAPVATPDRLLVAPEGLHRFYLDPPSRPAAERRVGVSWMTREDRDTDIADYVRYLDQLHDTLAPAGAAAPVVLGFSQGVATAARWAVLGAVRPAALVLWGSPLPPDLDWPRAAERLAGCEVILVAGDEDPAFPPEQVEAEIGRLIEFGIAHHVVDYAGGHRIEPEALGLVERTLEKLQME